MDTLGWHVVSVAQPGLSRWRRCGERRRQLGDMPTQRGIRSRRKNSKRSVKSGWQAGSQTSSLVVSAGRQISHFAVHKQSKKKKSSRQKLYTALKNDRKLFDWQWQLDPPPSLLPRASERASEEKSQKSVILYQGLEPNLVWRLGGCIVGR